MPFKSLKQMRYMYATHPKIAKEFSSEMTKEDFKKLPEKKRKMQAMKDYLKEKK